MPSSLWPVAPDDLRVVRDLQRATVSDVTDTLPSPPLGPGVAPA